MCDHKDKSYVIKRKTSLEGKCVCVCVFTCFHNKVNIRWVLAGLFPFLKHSSWFTECYSWLGFKIRKPGNFSIYYLWQLNYSLIIILLVIETGLYNGGLWVVCFVYITNQQVRMTNQLSFVICNLFNVCLPKMSHGACAFNAACCTYIFELFCL